MHLFSCSPSLLYSASTYFQLFKGTKQKWGGFTEGVSGKKGRKKKKHQRCHEGQSHQLRNIHQWVGKCDGTVMTGEQATSPTLAHSPWPRSPSGRKHVGHSEYV